MTDVFTKARRRATAELEGFENAFQLRQEMRMKNYCDYNAGRKPAAHEHADTIEPDPIMVGEYDWESAPDSLKAHFIGADEEETE